MMAEVVFAVPNDGSGEIMNKADIKGRIALVNRGTVRHNTQHTHTHSLAADSAQRTKRGLRKGQRDCRAGRQLSGLVCGVLSWTMCAVL